MILKSDCLLQYLKIAPTFDSFFKMLQWIKEGWAVKHLDNMVKIRERAPHNEKLEATRGQSNDEKS